ncbi:MAG TPA: hypothetical protein VLF71_02660 [Candidatus Saccharimonadales bacterium]|nr:hypothetical protein [Candidatus Saccharimonadales bacterium]
MHETPLTAEPGPQSRCVFAQMLAAQADGAEQARLAEILAEAVIPLTGASDPAEVLICPNATRTDFSRCELQLGALAQLAVTGDAKFHAKADHAIREQTPPTCRYRLWNTSEYRNPATINWPAAGQEDTQGSDPPAGP